MPVHIGTKQQKQVHPRSVDGFCERHGICRASFYNLAKKGLAPDVLKIGARVTVPEEAEAEWVRRNTVQMNTAA